MPRVPGEGKILSEIRDSKHLRTLERSPPAPGAHRHTQELPNGAPPSFWSRPETLVREAQCLWGYYNPSQRENYDCSPFLSAKYTPGTILKASPAVPNSSPLHLWAVSTTISSVLQMRDLRPLLALLAVFVCHLAGERIPRVREWLRSLRRVFDSASKPPLPECKLV